MKLRAYNKEVNKLFDVVKIDLLNQELVVITEDCIKLDWSKEFSSLKVKIMNEIPVIEYFEKSIFEFDLVYIEGQENMSGYMRHPRQIKHLGYIYFHNFTLSYKIKFIAPEGNDDDNQVIDIIDLSCTDIDKIILIDGKNLLSSPELREIYGFDIEGDLWQDR